MATAVAIAMIPAPAQAQSYEYHSSASCDELYVAVQSDQDLEWRVDFTTLDGQDDELWNTEPRQADAGELSWTFEVRTDRHGTFISLPDREYPSRFFAFDVSNFQFSTEHRVVGSNDEWQQVNSDQDTWNGPTDCAPESEAEGDQGHNCCSYEDPEQQEVSGAEPEISTITKWIQMLIDWIESLLGKE